MGRIVIGGYGDGNLNLHIEDRLCRAMQSAILNRLSAGQGLFLRYAGMLDNGQQMITAVWIGASSSLRFEYDGHFMPEVDQELVSAYQELIDSKGGIILPSKAEMDQLLEDEAN